MATGGSGRLSPWQREGKVSGESEWGVFQEGSQFPPDPSLRIRATPLMLRLLLSVTRSRKTEN